MIEVPTLTEKDASGFNLSNSVVSSAEVFDTTQSSTLATLTTVPDRLLYAGAIHPGLRTVAPFDVRFERTESGYAAVVQELEEYGLGDTRSEALEDLRKTLQELYLSLERDESRLSGDLPSVWARLKSHVTRIRR
jgi:hypothetical protein